MVGLSPRATTKRSDTLHTWHMVMTGRRHPARRARSELGKPAEGVVRRHGQEAGRRDADGVADRRHRHRELPLLGRHLEVKRTC